MNLVESLERRTFLSASSVPSEAIDGPAIRARIEQLKTVRANLDAGSQTIREATAGLRDQVRTLLTDARAQAQLDRAAIRAARGNADDLAAAKADALAHRQQFKADLLGLRTSLRRQIADARASVGENKSTLRRGIKAFRSEWNSDLRVKLEAVKDKPEVQKLFADAKLIAADSDVTQADLANLADAFKSALGDATAPSDQTVDGLVTTARGALEDGTLTDEERAALTESAKAVLRSANVPDAAIDRIVASVQTIFDKSNVTPAEADAIAADLHAALGVLGQLFR